MMILMMIVVVVVVVVMMMAMNAMMIMMMMMVQRVCACMLRALHTSSRVISLVEIQLVSILEGGVK